MTTQNLYQKTLNEEMTPSQFLWHVRRDPQYNQLITNTMSFEDTINCLKSKGFIWEALEQGSNIKSVDFLGDFKKLTEAASKKQKLKGGKGDKLTPDQVNYFEFTKGWKHELEHTDDIDKAKEIALDHLAEDPMYYTRLQMIEFGKSKKERSDLPIDISKKKASVKDEKNQMTPVKKAKKEKPNVSDSGKQEKARSKNAGVKKMKGGSGEMKSLKEEKELDPEQKAILAKAAADERRAEQIKKAQMGELEYEMQKNKKPSDKSGLQKDEEKGQFKLSKTGEKDKTISITYKQYSTLINRNKAEKEDSKLFTSITPIDDISKKIVDTYEEREKQSQIEKDLERKKQEKIEREKARLFANISPEKSNKKVQKNGITYIGTADPSKPDFYIYKPEVPKQEPHTEVEEYKETEEDVDGKKVVKHKLLNKFIMPNRVFKSMTGVSPEQAKKDEMYPATTKYTTGDKIVYKIPSKQKSSTIIKTTGVGGSQKDASGRAIGTAAKPDKKSTGTTKVSIDPSSIDYNTFVAIDPNKKELVKVFKDKEESKSFAAKFPTLVVTRYGVGKKQYLSEEKETLPTPGLEIVFSIQDPENLSAIEQVRNTISGAKFNKDKKELILSMSGKGDLVFTADASGKPVGVYFPQGKQSGVTNKVVDSDIKSPLNKILKKYYPKPEDVEKGGDTDKVLEEYIRQRIRKALREGDEGPFIGTVGPDVVKKKLIDYMKKYSPDWQTDPSPEQRSVGAEYQGIISKLVAELNDKEPGLGTSIYKQYTGDTLRGDQADQATPPPQTLAYDPAKLVSRGGRIAEQAPLSDEEKAIVTNAKRYNDKNSPEFKNALKDLQGLIQSYGEKGKDVPKEVLKALMQMSDINK